MPGFCNLIQKHFLFVLRLFGGLFILCIPFSASSAQANHAADKTPEDVYSRVLILKKQVELLRKTNKVQDESWINQGEQQHKEPRHVYQKVLEVLQKINRYRMIKKMGKISIPPYPGRNITPNEVFTLMERLVDEFNLLLPEELQQLDHLGHYEHSFTGKSSNDVYRELWEVSNGFDAVLGVRGFNPSDTLSRVKEITDIVRFLRQSQGESLEVTVPEQPIGKHPNHALKEIYLLLEEIRKAEKQLWMKNPIEVPSVPKRVITPTEAYDATGDVLAELQRIKYRLGLEKDFPLHKPETRKMCQDVIAETRLAKALLPDFSRNKNIKQKDPSLLRKTPNHVFALTERLIAYLKAYRDKKNITSPVPDVPYIENLKPKHVYQKAIECLQKTNNLRIREGASSIAVPRYPLRNITPDEVYDLVKRLEDEIGIALSKGFSNEGEINENYHDKMPSDVYKNIWTISLLIDSITGGENFTPNDVYPEAQNILSEARIIAKELGFSQENSQIKEFSSKAKEPSDVFELSVGLLKRVQEMQVHAGVPDVGQIFVPVSGPITPANVFDHIGLVRAELIVLKVHLGLSEEAPHFKTATDKNPSDVYNVLEQAVVILQNILHGIEKE